MASTDEYWQHAKECSRWAAEALSETDRDAFLEMAKIWTQLALQERLPPAEFLQSSERVMAAKRPPRS